MEKNPKQTAPEARFEFGKNWRSFLALLDEERIDQASRDLTGMLDQDRLEGKSFLDIGSGSGLSSLAARRLGARICSFDLDAQSVACTAELRRRYFSGDANWLVERGSALDEAFIRSLGRFDIVYAWGVLHHTGNMWRALDLAALPVKEGGQLFIAIYNEQGLLSRFWKLVKRCYCAGWLGRALVVSVFFPVFFGYNAIAGLVRHGNPAFRFTQYGRLKRGMSILHDWTDWLGGYPFEVARPDQICRFYEKRGFTVQKTVLTGGLGCNEFVFVKSSRESDLGASAVEALP
jgi:2-polyprenyl-6-hydroxyphenyl methylase/3-demethylubiquinone-9 3-methyltransferase